MEKHVLHPWKSTNVPKLWFYNHSMFKRHVSFFGGEKIIFWTKLFEGSGLPCPTWDNFGFNFSNRVCTSHGPKDIIQNCWPKNDSKSSMKVQKKTSIFLAKWNNIIRGIPLLNHNLGAQLVWGHYNLTRYLVSPKARLKVNPSLMFAEFPSLTKPFLSASNWLICSFTAFVAADSFSGSSSCRICWEEFHGEFSPRVFFGWIIGEGPAIRGDHHLVVSTHLKNMLVKLHHLPGETLKKKMKPPPSHRSTKKALPNLYPLNHLQPSNYFVTPDILLDRRSFFTNRGCDKVFCFCQGCVVYEFFCLETAIIQCQIKKIDQNSVKKDTLQ